MKLFGYLACFIFAFSIVSAGTMICIDLDDPSAPANLGVSGDVGSILLEWEAAVDEPSCSGIDEYVISREGVEIGRVGGNILSFIDNENLDEGEYVYTVYAIDKVGRNAGSAIKNVIKVEGRRTYGGGSSGGYICVENWECGEWTECVGNDMRRLCNDLDKCGTVKNKPETYQECGLVSRDENIILDNTNSGEESQEGFFSAITGAVTGGQAAGIAAVLLFILLIIIGFVIVKKRRKKK